MCSKARQVESVSSYLEKSVSSAAVFRLEDPNLRKGQQATQVALKNNY